MWNECKGFIALMAITLLVACLIIIGMFIQKEASRDLPRLKPKEVSMNVAVAPRAQQAQRSNYAYAQKAKVKNPNNFAIANRANKSYSYSFAPHAKNMPKTNFGVAPHAKKHVYPKGTLFLKSPENTKNESH